MFEPGYTPRGWKRGCAIDLALPPNFPGVRTYGEMCRGKVGRIMVVERGATHTVKFTSDDVPQVRAWLMWWYEGSEQMRKWVAEQFKGRV